MDSNNNQTDAAPPRHLYSQDANAANSLANTTTSQFSNITLGGSSNMNDGRGDGRVSSSSASGAATATMVITQQQQQQSDTNDDEEAPILRLSLRPQANVTWDENVINNEGLGRKSSKRCCIFHKQRPFGESSTESSEEDGNDSSSSSSSGGGGSGRAQRPMARKKNKKKSGGVGRPKIPDYQRFHA